MNRTELYRQWLQEEDAARMKGWDFSHLRGRYEEEQDLAWDYAQVVRAFLQPDRELLDMDTGGGEFLLSLKHPHNKTIATEGWPPNADLCRRRLSPLGIRFEQADGEGPLPFADGTFDLILNRHGSYDPAEISRLLRPGGTFITEQAGAKNDRELVELLLGGIAAALPAANTRLRRRGGEKRRTASAARGRSLSPHPVLGYRGAGVVCPRAALGVPGLFGGNLPGAAVPRTGDSGAEWRGGGNDPSVFAGGAKG